MDTGLTNKVVLVTGGSSGIGAATAVAYGAAGARVAPPTVPAPTGHGRWPSASRGRRRGARRTSRPGTARDHRTGGRRGDRAVGDVDALIGNAVRWGTIMPNSIPFEEVPAEEWTAGLHANVVGNALLVKAVLPGMRANGFGRIVLISSGVAEEGVPGPGVYGTAKMALHGMARALAWDAGRDGILVNVVAAGLTLTERERPVSQEMLDSVAARTPTRRLSTAEDTAGLILYLGSGANRNLTGEIVRDGSNAARSAHL